MNDENSPRMLREPGFWRHWVEPPKSFFGRAQGLVMRWRGIRRGRWETIDEVIWRLANERGANGELGKGTLAQLNAAFDYLESTP